MNLKSVSLLLSLCHAGAAAALGLGELDVRSRLGQPLHATVNILGASTAAAADCFSLAPGNNSIAPPLRAQLSIEQTGDQTLLHIRTPHAVQDPIAQFVLVSDCEGRLQRDYVVLLDPPEAAPAVIAAAPAPTAAPAVADSAPRAAVPQARPRRAAPRARSTPRAPQPALPVARAAKAESSPRLVLSGRSRTADAPFALRLDTNLPDLTRPRPVSLTATELSDENTALSRKLAHLEAQLLALQQRNTALEARRAAAPAVAAPPAPGQPAQWPLYLLFTGLVGGAGILVVWLRRSRHPPPLIFDDAPWTETPAMSKPEAWVAAPQPEPQWPEIAPPTLQESTEIKDDILDQAEVYMAHGHGDLAMHLLQEHLREAPTESPVPWLLLLDLLHRSGDVEGYAAASAECRRHFNVNLTGHPISQDSEPGQGLEAYPHLLDRLVEAWDTPHIDDFFKELIYDQRGGTRIGFEPAAYRDILLLRAIAHEALPLAA